ncbi:hypothetical protein [Pseudoduganella aquatica]|uniref:Uncharacterized protein n=1 Tax=Pseudoduganella aquatica TaxID=2660641 RepID=A0A7X4HIK1_9BURK|nr:hypothetical protein [Pseudoduganella aquatica]MYN11132.1 hypothetical protein [Pseudoduganella aquatica]
MQHAQHESIFSNIRKLFTSETPAKNHAAEIRPLTEDELRAVAGGPELEVSAGG